MDEVLSLESLPDDVIALILQCALPRPSTERSFACAGEVIDQAYSLIRTTHLRTLRTVCSRFRDVVDRNCRKLIMTTSEAQLGGSAERFASVTKVCISLRARYDKADVFQLSNLQDIEIHLPDEGICAGTVLKTVETLGRDR